MERLITFISGRIISVVLLVLFNVLLVRLMATTEYGLYAVLISLASIANTLGSLGAQRFLPKYMSLARSPENAATVQSMALAFISLRFVIVLVSAGLCLLISNLWLSKDITVNPSAFIPFIFLSVISSLYADAEVVSQSLNQQRISRVVAISEPLFRTTAVAVLVLFHVALSGVGVVWIMIATQGLAWVTLAANAWVTLRQKVKSVTQAGGKPPRHEIIGIISSGYVSGLTALGASPPFIRLVAANFLSASEFAALSFVQTITLSLQRYSPGFLLFPFLEPAIMGWQTSQKEEGQAKAGAALSLIAKVDAFIITFGILALAPLATEILQLLAGDRIAPRPLILLLSMAAIIGGTVVRCSEVAASFVSAYKAIFLSSGLSFLFVSILVFGGPYLGIAAILAFPIVDSLTRSFAMEAAAKSRGFVAVIDWSRILLCFGLIAASVLLSERIFAPLGFSLLEKFAFSAGMIAVGAVCFLILKPLTKAEGTLIAAYVRSPRIGRLLGWLTRG